MRLSDLGWGSLGCLFFSIFNASGWALFFLYLWLRKGMAMAIGFRRVLHVSTGLYLGLSLYPHIHSIFTIFQWLIFATRGKSAERFMTIIEKGLSET